MSSTMMKKSFSFLFNRTPLFTRTPVRFLNLHEYQSKSIMAEYGVNVQQFQVAESANEAKKAALSLGVDEVVIKAQILAGGRGKGVFSSGLVGGVKVTKDLESVDKICDQMIGHKLTTKQTTKEGVKVTKVMVAEALDLARETYLAIVLDRSHQGPVLVCSPEGGVDIEEVAEKYPEKIYKLPVNIMDGLTIDQALSLANDLEFKGELAKVAAEQIMKLYNLFTSVDATQVEINPFGETPDGRVVCFDAKINFDDNAQFRQKAIFAEEDKSESDPREVAAGNHDLNYIGMDGNIGCLVNGAGLAMATMDIIKLHDGEPANFLDVGGKVNENQVLEAFKILTSDPQVKAILVNIFGGIVNCATIANGIIAASKQISLKIPLIVRLEGTNAQNAREILESSGLAITTANDLSDAANKAVSCL